MQRRKKIAKNPIIRHVNKMHVLVTTEIFYYIYILDHIHENFIDIARTYPCGNSE
jgi:hypothetical protein